MRVLLSCIIRIKIISKLLMPMLTIKKQSKLVADNTLKLILLVFEDISCEISYELSARQMICMKYQALFSLKNKKKKI